MDDVEAPAGDKPSANAPASAQLSPNEPTLEDEACVWVKTEAYGFWPAMGFPRSRAPESLKADVDEDERLVYWFGCGGDLFTIYCGFDENDLVPYEHGGGSFLSTVLEKIEDDDLKKQLSLAVSEADFYSQSPSRYFPTEPDALESEIQYRLRTIVKEKDLKVINDEQKGVKRSRAMSKISNFLKELPTDKAVVGLVTKARKRLKKEAKEQHAKESKDERFVRLLELLVHERSEESPDSERTLKYLNKLWKCDPPAALLNGQKDKLAAIMDLKKKSPKDSDLRTAAKKCIDKFKDIHLKAQAELEASTRGA